MSFDALRYDGMCMGACVMLLSMYNVVQDGYTPLNSAASHGHLDVVKFLCEETEADVESKSFVRVCAFVLCMI